MQCACAILSSVACPSLQYFSTLSHKRTILGEMTKNGMRVLIPSAMFVWNIPHSKNKWARYDQKCILVFKRSTRYSCVIFMKLELSWQISEKHSPIKFHENPSNGSRVVPYGETDGRRDRHDETIIDKHNIAYALFHIQNCISLKRWFQC